MNRARTGWALAMAVTWAALAQVATSDERTDQQDKQQALVKAGLALSPAELADKQATLKAASEAARKDASPAVPVTPTLIVGPSTVLPDAQAGVPGLSADELADKLAAERAWDMQRTIDWKLANNLQLTPAEKQWVDAHTPAAPKNPAHHTDEGGPDTFGNTWIMTGDEGGPAYTWVDIPEANRTYLTLTDDGVATVDLGGSLSYYGTSYSQGFLGANGMLGFTNVGLGTWTNAAIPLAATPNNMLAVYWDDLAPHNGGQVYYGMVNGDFVATWDAVPPLASNTENLTVQIVIDFDNTAVYFNYNNFTAGLATNSCTIGIEGPDGTDALQVLFNGAPTVPAAQTTIRFDLAPPPSYAMSIAPTSANITSSPGDDAASQFTLFNAGLTVDSYTLATTAPGIEFGTFVDGQPVTNVGPLDPGESVVIDVLGTVPNDQPSGVDVCTVLVESVNSDNEATFTLNTTVFNAAFGGPDAFGNTWTSSAGGDVEYSWVVTPEENRTYLTLTDDSFQGPFPLNGVVSYYGDAYTEIFVGSNGNLGFASTGLNALGNAAIPTAATPNNILPFFWDDLNPSSGGQVYYGNVDGDFVLTFDAVREFGGTGTLTAQVVIDFDDAAIYYNYAALVAPLDVTSCTIGIENETGTDGLQVIFNNAPGPPVAEWTVRFDLAPPPDYAVSISPLAINQSAGPGQTLETDFTVFNSGLLADSYTLSVTDGEYVNWTVMSNGSPQNNTGVIQPLEGATLQLVGQVDPEAPTSVDSATLTAVSDNGEGVSISVPITTTIFNAAGGGPDAFGNTWVSSAGGEQEYFWVELENPTTVTLADNAVAGPFPLGGVLNWYGVPKTQFYIGSNGLLGFGTVGMTTTINGVIPATTTPNGLIALFWDNMNPAAGGTVSYGTDPDGRLVVTYDAVAQVPAAPGTLTAQVVVDFENQAVYCNYAQVEGLVLNSCTIGIEDDGGTDGLAVITNGVPGLPLQEWTIRFDLVPPPPFQMDLVGSAAIQASSDNTVYGTYTVGNAGSAEDSYTLSVTGASQFTYSFEDLDGNPITTVGPLAALSSQEFRLVVTVPEDMGGVIETVSVVATSQGNNQLSDQVSTTVTVITTSGGDQYGNTWVSNLDPDGTAHFFLELAPGDRTPITLADDNFAGPFDMGGTLSFYGMPQTAVYVGSNGMIGFSDLGMGSLGNQDLPNVATPNGIIALFWDDLNPGAGGQVYYGTGPDGEFIVTYDNVSEFGGTGTLRAQVVIDLDDEIVYLNYAALNAPLDVTSCTIGIENYEGNDAAEVVYNNAPWSPFAGMTIRFDLAPPPNYWPSLEDGVTAVGAADSEVTVSMDVSNLGLLPDAFAITATANNGIEVDVLINGVPGVQTPVIASEGSFTFELELSIPEVPGGPSATVTVTATSLADGTRTDQTTATLTIVLVQGGPDGGGYYWSTSDADGQVEYEWITIQNPVTATGFADDNFIGPFDMGITWTHYGNEYSQVYFASNGSLGFTSDGMNNLGNTAYPTAAVPNNMISFFWDDMNPTSGGTITYGTQDGMFILQWDAVREYSGAGTITCQVILDTNDDAVKINYQTLAAPLDILSCTIGQENADGSQGFSACFNNTGWLPHDGAAIWFGFDVIGPSGPYAVRIRPSDVSGVGITGGYAEYEFEVENRGENPSAFDLVGEGNVWDVTYHDMDDDWAEITSIPLLGVDGSFNLGVRVHVPEVPESFTDLLHLTVVSAEDENAWDDTQILTASSCSHTEQVSANVTGNGLFGMGHLMDGDWVSGETVVWMGTLVNRMVMQNAETGTVGGIVAVPFGHEYMGIAHDSRDGTFWVSYTGGISHVNASGALIAAFTPPLLDVATGRVPTGLAFDGDANILWAICANGAIDEFVRIDVADAANPVGLNSLLVPWSTPGGSGSAGLDYNEGSDQLVALHTGSGTTECFLDLGDGTVDARGDFCPSGLVDAHGVALHEDGRLFVGWTNGLAHPVEEYVVPCAITAQDREAMLLPTEFELGANYPNPFNPSTVIRYALPVQGMVRMEVYNLIGQHQQTLVNDLRPAGFHEVRFDASAQASGVYFYRLTVSDLQGTRLFEDAGKMILMK